MQTITFEIQTDLAKRIEKYLQFFGNKEIMFDKFIEYHINRIKREIALMQKDLEEYEQKYNMSSDKFYEQFESGELGDSKDFIVWSGIYEMHMDCNRKLQKLL
jgi:hypothetical protein